MHLKLVNDASYNCAGEIVKLEKIFGDTTKTGISATEWANIARNDILYTKVVREVALRPKFATDVEYAAERIRISEKIKI